MWVAADSPSTSWPLLVFLSSAFVQFSYCQSGLQEAMGGFPMPNLTLGELCHPAEMAVQMGRSLRELFPPLLSLSCWSAATSVCSRVGLRWIIHLSTEGKQMKQGANSSVSKGGWDMFKEFLLLFFTLPPPPKKFFFTVLLSPFFLISISLYSLSGIVLGMSVHSRGKHTSRAIPSIWSRHPGMHTQLWVGRAERQSMISRAEPQSAHGDRLAQEVGTLPSAFQPCAPLRKILQTVIYAAACLLPPCLAASHTFTSWSVLPGLNLPCQLSLTLASLDLLMRFSCLAYQYLTTSIQLKSHLPVPRTHASCILF